MSIKYRASLTVAATFLSSALLGSSSAWAGNPAEPVVVTATRDSATTRYVSHRDLDLQLALDQRRLDQRVGSAIKDVCAIGDYHAKRTITASSDYHGCSKLAWNGARPQIDAAIARAGAAFAGGGDYVSTTIFVSAGG
jgi:UrcA family protein